MQGDPVSTQAVDPALRLEEESLVSRLRRGLFDRGARAGKPRGVDASWSVLVFGVPPERRAEVDDIFPEFRKTFISRTAPASVVRRHFRASGQKVALCWGASPPRNLAELGERHPELQTVSIYQGPFDIVADRIYRAYAIDWTGLYVNPRRICDFEYFANVFPFAKNARLVQASGALRAQLCGAGAARPDQTVVVLAQDRGDPAFALAAAGVSQVELIKLAAAENPDAPIALASAAASAGASRLLQQIRAELDAPTAARVTTIVAEADLFDLLTRCAKVYTVSAPAGAAAVLAGRPVVAFGPAFYAGWGLTEDRASVLRRQRTLTRDEFAALVFGLYFRWIADDGALLFPGLVAEESA